MTSLTPSKNSDFLSKHDANIAASLAHRLDVARATCNTALIALLEQEENQLKSVCPPSTTAHTAQGWMATLKQWMTAIANSSKLTVERIRDESGEIWWYAFDPRTGKTLYAENESEVVQWIEDNRLGQ